VNENVKKLLENVKKLNVPTELKNYFVRIIKEVDKCYTVALKARAKKVDPEETPESILSWDMADRIEHLVGPKGISHFIREHINLPREELAIKIINYVIEEYYGIYPLKDLIELSLRLALAVLTEGMTIAPIEGLQKVEIKDSPYGKYLSIYFSGPIRAAGGTEAGLIVVFADYVRRRLGLAPYRPIRRPGEDEVQRYIEELRLHEREVGKFQFKCSDEQIERVIENLPVEVTGPPTTEVEVLVNRDLSRVETNKLRGGALRVINDGIIGRARKILMITEKLNIEGWEWLQGLISKESKSDVTNSAFIEDVIMGRPVISLENHMSSFRIRYGRGSNMGISAIGIHPSVFPLLNHFIVIGSQIKVDYPGKGAIVVPSEKAEPPIVELDDGSVVRMYTPELVEKYSDKIKKILWLGDIIISYGDILENNRELRPSPYVDEWWIQEVYEKIRELDEIKREHVIAMIEKARFDISAALSLSNLLKVPLHPNFTLRWNRISPVELIQLLESLLDNSDVNNGTVIIPYSDFITNMFKKLLIPFSLRDNNIYVEGREAQILISLVNIYSKKKSTVNVSDFKQTRDLVGWFLGVEVRDVEGSKINARLGRPEKASPRKLKPPVHVLFPIGEYGGLTRDIIKAYNEYHRIVLELSVKVCPKCGTVTPYSYCPNCKVKTVQYYFCPKCRELSSSNVCRRCGSKAFPYREYTLDVKEFFSSFFSQMGVVPNKLKGVKSLMNEEKVPEHLAKGILRALHNVYIFKDGTCRVDITNAPLMKFRPKDIGVSPKKLSSLGYRVNNVNEWLSLYPQDIIIPKSVAKYLLRIANFIDDLLTKLYGFKDGFYKLKDINDLIGHLIVGLSPHTSAGIIGRIIGFTDAQVLYAHPLWHAAKRRDCDGDQDSIMLLLDVLLNFSTHFLPTGPGGKMDAPLFINVVLIPEEVDTQPHNMDVVDHYPIDFYKATLARLPSKDVKDKIKVLGEYLFTKSRYGPFLSTEDPPSLSLKVNKSTYSRIREMKKKVRGQLKLMDLIFDNNTKKWLVESIFNKHIFPDIMGNLRAYLTQVFKCKNCGRVYRRPLLRGRCEHCGGDLRQTVHAKSVTKYLGIAKELIKEVPVDEYIMARLSVLEREIQSTVKIEEDKYQKLTTFFNQS